MNAHIERIMRDLQESLEELYNDGYQMGKVDQERDDIVKIDEAYDRGAEDGYAEGEKNGYREGKKEVKN
jgi:flagellar biosynthesis/type III secretory pathway protein FliH